MEDAMEALGRLKAISRASCPPEGLEKVDFELVETVLSGEDAGPDAVSGAEAALDELEGVIKGLNKGVLEQPETISEAHGIIRRLKERLMDPPGVIRRK